LIKKRIVMVLLLFGFALLAREYQLVTLDYPPYQYEENGKVKGLATEIIKEVFHRMGDDVKISIYPWKRSLELVKNGSADAVFTVYHTTEREAFLDYCAEVLIQQKTAIFVLRNSKVKYSGHLEDLQSESFGVVLGVNYGDKFELFTKKNQPKIASYYDGLSNMRGMLTGLHSITVSNVLGATTILKSMNKESQVKMLEPVLQDIASYLAFSKAAKLTNIRDKFDKTLKQMKADGTYKKIISKYL